MPENMAEPFRCFRLALLALLVSLAPMAASGAERCPVRGKPARAVDVVTTIVDPVVRNDRRRVELTAAAGRLGMPSFNAGLTRSEVTFALSPEIWSVDLDGERACIGFGTVTANWALASITIDIAAEYRPGSCQYEAIREHENQHVALTLKVFEDWERRIRNGLMTLMVEEPSQLVEPANREAKAQQMIARLEAGMRAELAAFEAERNAVNATIDTRESYLAQAAKCR